MVTRVFNRFYNFQNSVCEFFLNRRRVSVFFCGSDTIFPSPDNMIIDFRERAREGGRETLIGYLSYMPQPVT